MGLNMTFGNDWKLNKNDFLYLSVIVVFSICLIYFRTNHFMANGIYFPDKTLYLMNALKYSGLDYYNIVNPSDLFLSTVISYLTSLLFNLGLVDHLAISLVSSVFAVFGFIGLFFLLRIRFNSLLSFTGVIIFGSMSELLINLSSGLLDVPAISISIFILLFGILAIDKNSKYFIFVFPLLVIGFFTRFTVGFIAPLLLLYYLFKRNFIENIDEVLNDNSKLSFKLKNYFKSSEFKYIGVSIILGGILIFLICKYLITDFGGSLSFIQMSHNSITNYGYGKGSGIDVIYDKLFYIKNFSHILFNEVRYLDMALACLLYLVIGCGALFKFIDIYKNHSNYLKLNQNYWKTKYFNKILIVLFILLIILAFISFKVYSNHMGANICLLIGITILYSFTKEFNFNHDENALNFLFLSYFFVYLVFMSIYSVKTFRYSIPLLPPLMYFIVYGLEGILDYISYKFNIKQTGDNFNEKKYSFYEKFIPICLIVIFMISSFSFVVPTNVYKSSNDLVDVTEYIISHDDDYHDKTFGSNFRDSRIIRWYLQDNVTVNNDYNEFDSSNISYIISNSTLELDNYYEIYKKGMYHLYCIMWY